MTGRCGFGTLVTRGSSRLSADTGLVVLALAILPDAAWVPPAGQDRTIKLWESDTGQELRTLRGHMGQVRCVAFSPDGRSLASASLSPDRSVRIWDADTGKQLRVLRGHQGGLMSVAYSPDGGVLASACADHTVKLWDPNTGLERFTLHGHASLVDGVVFSPDGERIASAGLDRTVQAVACRHGPTARGALRSHRCGSWRGV